MFFIGSYLSNTQLTGSLPPQLWDIGFRRGGFSLLYLCVCPRRPTSPMSHTDFTLSDECPTLSPC